MSQAAFSLRDRGLMAMQGSPSVLCDLQKAQALIGSTGLTWELEKPSPGSWRGDGCASSAHARGNVCAHHPSGGLCGRAGIGVPLWLGCPDLFLGY